MRQPCLVTYLFESLLDCGWSGLLYVDGSGIPYIPPEASATTSLELPVIAPPLQSSPSRHTRSKDPNMAVKGAQLCLLPFGHGGPPRR